MAGSKVEHEIENEAGLQRTLKDLFAGAVGGVAQVLLGMWVPCFVCSGGAARGAGCFRCRRCPCVEYICICANYARRPAIRYVVVSLKERVARQAERN
jgi:hypothetical protein